MQMNHVLGHLIALARGGIEPPYFTQAEWEALIRLGRRCNLLGRLATLLDNDGTLDRVPEAPRAHLLSALTLARHHQVSVLREVEHLRKALGTAGIKLVLLKGAAYVLADLPPAAGRLFSDIDILVPEAALGQAEAALMLHGWLTAKESRYDQRYYRQWMHELPPMQHVRRQTIVDVHHNVVPRTGRSRPDAARLLAAVIPAAVRPDVSTLAPADMVLHCATHLFHEGEFSQGLRDLLDLDGLLRHFGGADAGFWDALPQRAAELDLCRPLYYGLRYAELLIGTAIPLRVMSKALEAAPPRLIRRWMDTLFRNGLLPEEPVGAARSALARQLLFVRSHWLRMPPHLLAYHLSVKALRQVRA